MLTLIYGRKRGQRVGVNSISIKSIQDLSTLEIPIEMELTPTLLSTLTLWLITNVYGITWHYMYNNAKKLG